MTETNETTRAILNHLFERRIFAWRQNTGGIPIPGKGIFRPAAKKGVADILGCIPPTGHLLAIEVKTGRDYPSPEQTGFLANVRNAGGIAMLVKSYEDFREQLDSQLSI